jgi:hypothetical protein
MKHLNKRTFKSFDTQEAMQILRREGDILMADDIEGNHGHYSGFLIEYKNTYWHIHMQNGEVYSIGWDDELLMGDCHPNIPMGQKDY